MTEALTITGLGTPEVTLTPEAVETRDGLLAQAAELTAVEDEIDADSAAAVLRDLTTFTRLIESGRTSVKKPVLDIGRQIDGVAKELVGTIKSESDRLSKLLGTYQAEQRRQAEAKVQEEQRKLQQEAEERARAITAAPTEELRQEAMEDAKIALAAQQDAVAEVTPPKIDGTQVRKTWKFEVTDIKALYKAAPYLCNIEPNSDAIRAAIKNGEQFPGLRTWQEAKTIITNR